MEVTQYTKYVRIHSLYLHLAIVPKLKPTVCHVVDTVLSNEVLSVTNTTAAEVWFENLVWKVVSRDGQKTKHFNTFKPQSKRLHL